MSPRRPPALFTLLRIATKAILCLVCIAALSSCARTDTTPVTRLQFWTLALRPFEAYMLQRIAAFEALHPGVKVDWIDVPFDALDRKLIAAAAADRAPDIVNMSDKTFARFISLGALADLRPLLPLGAEDAYLPGARRLGEIDSNLLAVPWYLTTQAVLANTRVLDLAGLSPASVPTRWSDLRAAARDFRAKALAKNERSTYLFSVPLGQESDLPMMLFAEGLSPLITDEKGRVRANLQHPAVRAEINEWVSLYRDGILPREAVTRGGDHLTDLYQNNKLGVINSGPNFLARIGQVSPAVFDSTVVGPPITGRLARAHVAVMVLAMTTQSKHPREAASFIAFMTSAESQEEFAKVVAILPSTASSLSRPMFDDFTAARDAMFQTQIAAAKRQGRPIPAEPPAEKLVQAALQSAKALRTAVAFTPALSVWPDMRRTFEEKMKRVLLDGLDLDAALKDIDNEWNRILDSAPDAPPSAIPLATLAPPAPSTTK